MFHNEVADNHSYINIHVLSFYRLVMNSKALARFQRIKVSEKLFQYL